MPADRPLPPVVLVIAAAGTVRQLAALTGRRDAADLVAADARRLGLPAPEPTAETSDARRYLLQHVPLVLAAAAVVGLFLAVGAAYLVGSFVLLITGHAWWAQVIGMIGGSVLLYVGWQGAGTSRAAERALFRRHFGDADLARLRRRVDDLAASRAAVVAAVDDERRRIERDLHDGVQQRLVGLGMVLGRAQRSRDAEHGRSLLVQAHDDAQDLLRDLREVAWRVYPAELDRDGLAPALDNLALRTPLPVSITGADVDLPLPVRTAVYFTVSEAVTNAVKHALADRMRVTVTSADGVVRVRIEDDGVGGADGTGGGLSGLARRAAALDGTLVVNSPNGGPTVVELELPCG